MLSSQDALNFARRKCDAYTEATGTELAAGKDSGMLKMAALCGMTTLLIFLSLLEVFVVHRLKM